MMQHDKETWPSSPTARPPPILDDEAIDFAIDAQQADDAATPFTNTNYDILKTMVAGGVSGAVAKTCTAPVARLTILYQV